jgi:hypothetical protein
MNQRPPGLKLSKCIEGFILYKSAESLRPRTLHSYQSHLERWNVDKDAFSVDAKVCEEYCIWPAYPPQNIIW